MVVTVSLVVVGVRPLAVESGNLGAVDGVREPHPDHVTTSGTISEAITTVEDMHVGDAVDVTWLGGEGELGGASDLLNGVQSLHLLHREHREVGLAGVGSRTQEGCAAEVELHRTVLRVAKDDRATLVTRKLKRPVTGSQDANQIRTGGSQDVVDRAGRRDDTVATGLSSSTSEPSHGIGTLLSVVGL